MIEIENTRKVEGSSYRFIFKIISILKKRKHWKWTDKNNSRKFSQNRKTWVSRWKGFSRCSAQWTHSKTYLHEISEKLGEREDPYQSPERKTKQTCFMQRIRNQNGIRKPEDSGLVSTFTFLKEDSFRQHHTQPNFIN